VAKIGKDSTVATNLLVVDYFSKFPLVVALPDKSASSVVNILKSLYAIYGLPMVVFGDKSAVPQSCSSIVCRDMGIPAGNLQPSIREFQRTIRACDTDGKNVIPEGGGGPNRPTHRINQLQGSAAVGYGQESGRAVSQSAPANEATGRH
jgi:hypothetical protein